MISLSLCMIVKNEEEVLDRCLECIKDIADEIVIVDTGSTDGTKRIAERYTPCVYDFAWCDDFAAARNYSFSRATKEYTMWLDADDVIDEHNQALLKELKETLAQETDMVMMRYDVAFDNQDNPTLSYFRERIFKTALKYQWIGEIHEVIPQSGKVEYREIAVYHKKLRPNEPERNLKIFEKMIAEGKELDPRQKYYYARELYYTGQYKKAIGEFEKFLTEGNGWVENNINACKDMAECCYLLQDDDAALKSLLRSLTFDQPRAEICCDIGKHFFNKEQYYIAIFWYELAAGMQMDQKNGGFCLPDCYGYIPNIQLCVCYDRIGEKEKASWYNEKAGAIKPQDPGYLFNKNYFEKELLSDNQR